MKNYHLDLIRVTESGAIAAAEWVGKGDKESADKAATDAMRDRLSKIDFRAEIAIGEGVKDKSFGLFQGEQFGINCCCSDIIMPAIAMFPQYSIAVDPIEGTTPTAKGGNEAVSVIALANYGCFFKTDAFYMNKIAVGPKVARYNRIDIDNDVNVNVRHIAEVLEKPINHVTVCLLDRPRHDHIVKQLRELGCRIKFISDCDVTACIATCVEDSGIDMYLGIGGAPEAVITAAAMRCMGGQIQAQIVDESGMIEGKVYYQNDLASGDVMFAATGITDGQLLKGVQFTSKGAITHSIAMRSESGTVRKMVTEHGN